MSDAVSTVGDLSGSNVIVDTVKISYRDSVIEGRITGLHFTTEFEASWGGSRNYSTTAQISLGDIHLEDVPLDTPAAVVTSSRPQ